ncbi:hypothetical protein ACXWTF_05090 [Thiomicrolovo sp. ZZH C-3]
MKWINTIAEEYSVDYISIYILLTSLPAFLLLMYVYIKLENTLLGLILNLFYFLTYVYFQQREASRLAKTKKWITLEADVSSVQIVNLMCFLWRTRTYYPKIKYTSTIESQKYRSDQLFLKKCSRIDFEDEAKSLAKHLIHNGKVRCYVNPNDHSQSILIRESQLKPEYFLTALMMFFISFIFIASDAIK